MKCTTIVLKRALIGLAFAACASSCWAQTNDAYPTGLDLVQRCNSLHQGTATPPDTDPQLQQDYGYCLGYLVGYVSGFAAREAGGAEGRFCPPEDARIRDFIGCHSSLAGGTPGGIGTTRRLRGGAGFSLEVSLCQPVSRAGSNWPA